MILLSTPPPWCATKHEYNLHQLQGFTTLQGGVGGRSQTAGLSRGGVATGPTACERERESESEPSPHNSSKRKRLMGPQLLFWKEKVGIDLKLGLGESSLK